MVELKVRIGYGHAGGGAAGAHDPSTEWRRFADLVDGLETLGFDSLWLPERITGARIDPVVGLSFAAGRTTRIKLGTCVMVLSGRNPALLAKELASLDVLSNGRFLPAFGLGAVDAAEQQAFNIAREDRAGWFEEALPLLRRFWLEDAVTHEGPRFRYDAVGIVPKPLQRPPDIWLGGRAPGELRRTGRLGDGWLPSFCTPQQAAEGRALVEAAAEAACRFIDPQHYGVLIGYTHDAVGGPMAASLGKRFGVDPQDVIPSGFEALHAQIERFIAVGFSKFIAFPLTAPMDWRRELEGAAEVLLPLQRSVNVPVPV